MKANQTARILSKGKSFAFSQWKPLVQYTNDCFKQDFVSYNNALLVCVESHFSTQDDPPILLYENPDNPYTVTGVNSDKWEYVMSGSPGLVYIPEYNDDTGILTWRTSASPEDLKPIRIKMTGPWADSKGESSATLGVQNKTGGDYAIAAGFGAEALGDYSQSFGYKTITNNNNEAAFGRFNKSIEGETIFSIGNGENEDSRNNLIEFKSDGTFYFNGEKKDFLTWDEINSAIASESERAKNAEKELSDKISKAEQTVSLGVTNLVRQINAETARATNAEEKIQSDVDLLNSNLLKESDRASASEEEIKSNLNSEISARKRTDEKLNTLIGPDSGKSSRDIALEEINKVIDGAPEAFDTLREISDYISDHGEDAMQMQNDITDLKNKFEWAEFD